MDRTTSVIEHLQRLVEIWEGEAENELLAARQSQEEAEDFSERLEQAISSVTSLTCPFCNDKMSDLTPLEPLVEELRRRHLYPNRKSAEPDLLSPQCRVCGTYQTGWPRHSARRWLPEDLEPEDKVFAVEAFDGLHRVDEVALENTGRGWMFRVGDSWYANPATKKCLKELFDI